MESDHVKQYGPNDRFEMQDGKVYVTEHSSQVTFEYPREGFTFRPTQGMDGDYDGIQVEQVTPDGGREIVASHPNCTAEGLDAEAHFVIPEEARD